MIAGPRARLLQHLELRRTLLCEAAETMFASLQLHVHACQRCAAGGCDDAAHATVRAIQEALGEDRTRRAAR